jgi:hypothetical protein
MIKRTVIRKIIKMAFEDAEFSQPDVVETDDDSWLRRNDSFIPMSGVTQLINNYVCNLTVSLGETGDQMQITLVSYPYSLVFALVCSLIFYSI